MLVEFEGVPLEIVKKPVKNINLRIYPPDANVRLSVPLHYSSEQITNFIKQHHSWICKQRERILQNHKPVKTEFVTGSTLNFQGQSYLLVCVEHHGPKKIQIQDHILYCYTKPDTSESQKNALFEQWSRKEMSLILPELIKKWEPIIGVKVSEWGIKKMKTRWGSCNTRAKRIWLNLNLIQKPIQCLECVLVHEMVHILEASHNARFYQLMTKFMPDWALWDKLLKP